MNNYKYVMFDNENKPILLNKEKVNNMSDIERFAYVHELAQFYLRKTFKNAYDTEHIHLELQSVHADDWYLYSVVAKKADNTSFSVWTLNIESGGLAHGHYDLTESNYVSKSLCIKRGYYND